PVLVGWAAVRGSVGTPAWILFAVVFCWTPPHFWALALRYSDDYRAAGIPMLPVTRGAARAARQIVVDSAGVVAVTLLLPVAADVGVLYVGTAVTLGAGFIARAVLLRRDPNPDRAIGFFATSNAYLALLFAAVAVDTLVGH